MKKWIYLSVIVFFVSAISIFVKLRSNGHHLKPVGYVPYFEKNNAYFYRQFKEKIRAPVPLWMQCQIAEDLKLEKITLQALEATQLAIAQKNIMSTNRYRIVNNKLYRYLDPVSAKVQESWSGFAKESIGWFEDGLKTLLELTHCPNVDFIVTHEDGTREPFYLVDDPSLQAPVLGWAKLRSTPFLVLIPDWRSVSAWWYKDLMKLKSGRGFQGDTIPWNQKRPVAFWRGALTNAAHRMQIASLSEENPFLIDAGICDGLDQAHPYYKTSASYEEHLQYKYLPVIDGVMCTYPGYQWRLLSDAVAFKQESDQIQWFYGALVPYVHYVPIKENLSDLTDQVTWAQANDDKCRQIAINATEFALKNLMFDDVYCYLYHVFVAYNHLQDESLEKDWGVTLLSDLWLPL